MNMVIEENIEVRDNANEKGYNPHRDNLFVGKVQYEIGKANEKVRLKGEKENMITVRGREILIDIFSGKSYSWKFAVGNGGSTPTYENDTKLNSILVLSGNGGNNYVDIDSANITKKTTPVSYITQNGVTTGDKNTTLSFGLELTSSLHGWGGETNVSEVGLFANNGGENELFARFTMSDKAIGSSENLKVVWDISV
jgi:hypothetical protein